MGGKGARSDYFSVIAYLNPLTQFDQPRIIEARMDKNKDSGVSGGVKFVTSTLGNVTGGLARTVGEYTLHKHHKNLWKISS